MSIKPAKRSSLFLPELIIAILFFSLASAVCIRFFVTSHALSRDTENLNMAVNQVSGYTELFFADDDFSSYIKEHCGKKTLTDNSSHFYIYYNDNWEICDENDSRFILDISLRKDKSFLYGTFSMDTVYKNDTIYTLDVRKYIGNSSKKQEVAE